MICSKCGANNVDEARFCAVCGADMSQSANTAEGYGQYAAAYPRGVPQNALPARKRDISAVTYAMMILNSVFTFLAILMLYIPTWWVRKGYTIGGSKKYFSLFSENIEHLKSKGVSDEKDLYITYVVLIIGFTLVAVAGIVLALLRFRFSAGLLAAAGAFAIAEMFELYLSWLSDSMFYAKYPKYNVADMKSQAYLPLVPVAFFFAISAVVFSAVVFATYRDRSKKEGQ